MKSKGMIYLLGFAVICIWGLLIYRIVKAATEGDEDNFVAPVVHERAYNDYATAKDTIHLSLNYRDPFGMVSQPDTTARSAENPMKIKAGNVPVKPQINWSFIQYGGYIKSTGSKTLLAIMHINGREVMMKEGETIQQVKLLRNVLDSIKVSYQGKIKFIPLKPGNQ